LALVPPLELGILGLQRLDGGRRLSKLTMQLGNLPLLLSH
jgi:hypothetical protein